MLQTRHQFIKITAPGGGVALIRAQKALDKLEGSNEDQTVGIRILSRSIEGRAKRSGLN